VAVANLWIPSRVLPAEAGSHTVHTQKLYFTAN
jgi:hypothetical protein